MLPFLCTLRTLSEGAENSQLKLGLFLVSSLSDEGTVFHPDATLTDDNERMVDE